MIQLKTLTQSLTASGTLSVLASAGFAQVGSCHYIGVLGGRGQEISSPTGTDGAGPAPDCAGNLPRVIPTAIATAKRPGQGRTGAAGHHEAAMAANRRLAEP